MGLLRNIKILLTGNIDYRGEYVPPLDPWMDGAENPVPRGEVGEFVKVEPVKTAPVKAVPVAAADPWGSVKKPRGALNPLKLAVTMFMVVDCVAALFFVSSNLTITAAALLVFIPNAVFLFLLRRKLG
jgi:hypothetical protein